jgi:hypothetical protein
MKPLAHSLVFIVLLAASARGSSPQIWFAPMDNSTRVHNVAAGIIPSNLSAPTDYMNLFAANAPWTQAESHVSVFKIYGWPIVDFTDAQLQTVFSFLNQHKISLAIEFGPLLPTTCGSGEGFGTQGGAQYTADRIKKNGGTLKYVAMDEPLFFGSINNAPGACQWTPAQVANNAVTSLNVLKNNFPGLIIGDIEPVPANGLAADWVQRYAAWMDAFQAATGSKLAFFHCDTGYLPTWITDVTNLRVETSKRGIPLGIIYNGLGNDTSDAQWLGRAQQHYLDFELSEGQPDQAIFQSWTGYPVTHLPETTPYTFTWLLDQYARPRPSLTLNTTLTQAGGSLLDGAGGPVASAPVTVTMHPLGGQGVVSDYVLTGPVPSSATSALVGIRINEECSCSGTADVSMYSFQYSETGAGSRTSTNDFSSGLNFWGLYDTGTSQLESTTIPPGQDLHVTAQPGQVVQLNSFNFNVTGNATYTLHIKARVSPQSAGSGYFLIIFIAGAGEIQRQTLNIQSGTLTLGAVQTAADGSYSVTFQAQPGDPTQLQTQADYPGVDYPAANALWPARSLSRYGPRPKPPSQMTSQ